MKYQRIKLGIGILHEVPLLPFLKGKGTELSERFGMGGRTVPSPIGKGGWLGASSSTEPHATKAAACVRQSYALTPRFALAVACNFNFNGTVHDDIAYFQPHFGLHCKLLFY